MGRTLKRVPLNFKWPIDKIWKGYINPYSKFRLDCKYCENGYSKEYSLLNAQMSKPINFTI